MKVGKEQPLQHSYFKLVMSFSKALIYATQLEDRPDVFNQATGYAIFSNSLHETINSRKRLGRIKLM